MAGGGGIGRRLTLHAQRRKALCGTAMQGANPCPPAIIKMEK